MNCEETRRALVGDDPSEQEAARRHAADCPSCAELLEGDLWLAAEVERWKAVSPEPPPSLEGRVLAQDEQSCVVAGMPGSAVREGVVDEVVDLGHIAERLRYLTR